MRPVQASREQEEGTAVDAETLTRSSQLVLGGLKYHPLEQKSKTKKRFKTERGSKANLHVGYYPSGKDSSKIIRVK